MFYQIFLLPQVKQSVIFIHKHGVYELPHKLLSKLTLKKLGKSQNFIEL